MELLDNYPVGMTLSCCQLSSLQSDGKEKERWDRHIFPTVNCEIIE